jgi:hypothetical protein
VPSTAEGRIQDLDETGTKQEKRGLDRKGIKRDSAKEKKRRQDKKDVKDLQEKELKDGMDGIPASHSTLKPTSHMKYRTVIDAKGNRVSVPITETIQARGRDNKKPIGRKGKLRQESGAYAIRGTEEGNKKLREADARFQRERDTTSITSFAEFLRDRKKNPAPSGGFVSAEEADKESETVDYKKWVTDREASAKKREQDAKDRKARGGPKVKPKKEKPKKEVPKEPPKVEEYQSEDDNEKEDKQEPDKDDGDEGPVTAREYKETGKALWKTWLKNKVGMKRMTEPEDTIQEQEKEQEKKITDEQKKRQADPKNQLNTREGESWKKFKERQDKVEDPREYKTLPEKIEDIRQQALARVKPESIAVPPGGFGAKPIPLPAPKPKPATKKPTGGFVQDEDDYKNLGKALWKSWLEKRGDWDKEEASKKQIGNTRRFKRRKTPMQYYDEDDNVAYGYDKKTREELKADRVDTTWFTAGALKHPKEFQAAKERAEAETKKDKEIKGIDEQLNEVNEKIAKLREMKRESKKAEEGMGGMLMGAQRGLGHEAGYKQDPGQSAQITEVKDEEEESKKSAYENNEQDESPEVKPNKQQIPASKPGMDVIRSMYKKALIIKYKNIYKPLNT